VRVCVCVRARVCTHKHRLAAVLGKGSCARVDGVKLARWQASPGRGGGVSWQVAWLWVTSSVAQSGIYPEGRHTLERTEP